MTTPDLSLDAQIAQANASGSTPVVFIHGLWLLASSWDRWADHFARGSWNAFVRVNNLFNRRYVGSVIVDDSNSRYFESAAPFNVLVGGALTWK